MKLVTIMMEKTSKINKPITLFGIKSIRDANEGEKKLYHLLEDLDKGIEEDPEAHEKLKKLGKKISKKSDLKGNAVDRFLEERKSVY